MFRIKKIKKWLKDPHIKHPKRWDRAFIVTRLITTCEWLYIILTPAWRAVSGVKGTRPDTWDWINIGLGIGFTIISEVIIITMQRVVFKNRQLIKENALLD